MQENVDYKLILNSNFFSIPSDFYYLNEIDNEIYTKLTTEHQYEIKSNVSVDTLHGLIDWWVYREALIIPINKISEFEMLKNEFHFKWPAQTIYQADFKIVILGSSSVGKTSFLCQFIDQTFSENVKKTLSANLRFTEIRISGFQINFHFWEKADDTSIDKGMSLLRGSNGIILMYDLTRVETFNKLNNYIKLIEDGEIFDNSKTKPILIIGNKTDETNEIKNEAEIENFINEHHLFSFQAVSSKTGENVHETIYNFADYLINKQKLLATFVKPTESVDQNESSIQSFQNLPTVSEEIKIESVLDNQQESEIDEMKSMKIVFLGNSSVGKTSIINRYLYDSFNENTPKTIFSSILSKTLDINNNKINLVFYDISGDERYHNYIPLYLRGLAGVILVYDITKDESFNKLNNYLKIIEDKEIFEDDKTKPILIIGNKIDETREIKNKNQIENIIKEHQLFSFQTVSSKTGQNVNESIHYFVDYLLNLQIQSEYTNNQNLLTISEDTKVENENKNETPLITDIESVLNQHESEIDEMNSIKIVLLGNSSVGKTSIINRYLYDSFNENTPKTIFSSVISKTINIKNKQINLVFYDISGDDRYRNYISSCLNGIAGVILVYDVTKEKSFRSLDSFLEIIENTLHYDDSYIKKKPILVVGNKIDIEDDFVNEDDVEKWVKENNLILGKSISCLSKQNLNETISDFIEFLMNEIESNKKNEQQKKMNTFVTSSSTYKNSSIIPYSQNKDINNHSYKKITFMDDFLAKTKNSKVSPKVKDNKITLNLFKIVVLGQSSVGKTSFLNQLCHQTFSEDYTKTVGAETFMHKIQILNCENQVILWDTSGSKEFDDIKSLFIRGSDGIIFMYDVTKDESFNELNNYLKIIEDKEIFEDDKTKPILIIGNKIDETREIKNKNQIENIIKEHQLFSFQTVSSKTGQNVNESIHFFVDYLLKMRMNSISENRYLLSFPENFTSFKFKIVLLKAENVDSIFNYHIYDDNDKKNNSEKIQFFKYTTKIQDHYVKLNIFEASSKDIDLFLLSPLLKDSNGVIILYDSANKTSIQSIDDYLSLIDEIGMYDDYETKPILVIEDIANSEFKEQQKIEKLLNNHKTLPLESLSFIGKTDINLIMREFISNLIEIEKQKSLNSNKIPKIIVLGQSSAGKTSYINQLCNHQFNENCPSTENVSSFKYSSKVGRIKMDAKVWDFPGNRKFLSLLPVYLKDTNAIILAFDMTDKRSFISLESFLAIIESTLNFNKNFNKPILVIGTNADSEKVDVKKCEVDDFTFRHKIFLYEFVSNKTGKNVNESFSFLLQYIVETQTNQENQCFYSIPFKLQTSERMQIITNMYSHQPSLSPSSTSPKTKTTKTTFLGINDVDEISDVNLIVKNLKIVILGDSYVGKTSLLERFCKNKFSSKMQKTTFVTYYTHVIKSNGYKILITFWDTSGDASYQHLLPIYSRGSDGAVIVYDVTNKDALKTLDSYFSILKKTINLDQNKTKPILIIGNKMDRVKNLNETQNDKVVKWANKNKINHCSFVSCLNGDNVKDSICNFIVDLLNLEEIFFNIDEFSEFD